MPRSLSFTGLTTESRCDDAPPLDRGDVVLISFPFSDLSAEKVRPALIAGRVTGEDLVLAFITSRVEALDPRADVLLDARASEFQATGLKVPSSVRLNKLATLHRSLARRRLGAIGPRTRRVVAGALRYVFAL